MNPKKTNILQIAHIRINEIVKFQNRVTFVVIRYQTPICPFIYLFLKLTHLDLTSISTPYFFNHQYKIILMQIQAHKFKYLTQSKQHRIYFILSKISKQSNHLSLSYQPHELYLMIIFADTLLNSSLSSNISTVSSLCSMVKDLECLCAGFQIFKSFPIINFVDNYLYQSERLYCAYFISSISLYYWSKLSKVVMTLFTNWPVILSDYPFCKQCNNSAQSLVYLVPPCQILAKYLFLYEVVFYMSFQQEATTESQQFLTTLGETLLFRVANYWFLGVSLRQHGQSGMAQTGGQARWLQHTNIFEQVQGKDGIIKYYRIMIN